MKKSLLGLLCLALLGTPFLAQDPEPAKPTWYADFDKALEAAKAGKKDMLVDFTGSDWCIWCKRLHEEVFATETFLKGVSEKYILVALDFPQSDEVKAAVPSPERNDELAKTHKIQGFPTVMLFSAEGVPYARTGYQEGGPEKYLSHLSEISTKGKEFMAKVDAVLADAKKAKEGERSAVITRALDLLETAEEGAPKVDDLAGLARESFTIDADNKAGLKARSLAALFKSSTANDDDVTLVRSFDAKNEMGLFEVAVDWLGAHVQSEEQLKTAAQSIEDLFAAGPLKSKEIDKRLSINAAFWNHRFLKDAEKAKTFAKRAMALLTDEDPEQLRAFLKEVIGEEKS